MDGSAVFRAVLLTIALFIKPSDERVFRDVCCCCFAGGWGGELMIVGWLAGTVPIYEAVGPPRPPEMVGTALVSPPTQTYVVRPVMQPVLQTLSPSMVQSLPLGQQAYPYGDVTEKRDGPLKRFLRGAADGFMLGAMGWLG
ncbi:unnamed protein product [Angiostrongylus costaricensis]|uniref:Secreted protein n=1 Tax=Angiostrongylus costaricensis TaxID=334426 RepID=A0A0R3PMH6_ANGCS|nr:unnamed protein product [Angiostrongylus costaricensis]